VIVHSLEPMEEEEEGEKEGESVRHITCHGEEGEDVVVVEEEDEGEEEEEGASIVVALGLLCLWTR